MKILITVNDFRSSTYASPNGCALAKGLKRKLPKSTICVRPFDVLINMEVWEIDLKSVFLLEPGCNSKNPTPLIVELRKRKY